MSNSKKHNLFRQESLERLSSPEKLDQLMQVTSRNDWLPLSVLGGILGAVLLWSLFGRVPVNVISKGLIILPNRIVDLQSPVKGQLKTLNIQEGNCIEKDQVIAAIDPSEIRQQLEQEQAKLVTLKVQEQAANSLQEQHTNSELQAIQRQQISKRQRLQDTQAITSNLRERELNAIQKERTSLQQQLQDTLALAPSFQERLEKRRALLETGAISQDQVFQVEQEYIQNDQQIVSLKAELEGLEVRQAEVEQKYRENRNTVTQLQAELQELETQRSGLEQENLEADIQRKNQIQDVEHKIAQLSKQYDDNRQIKSPFSGCILELTTSKGSVINEGTRLGAIQVDEASAPLLSVIYFPIGDGKKIQPGMKIQVTPDTVRRERFGGIVGTVSHVSAFPITKEGAARLVGNPEVIENLVSQTGSAIAVQAELDLDPSTPSGYRWSSSRGPANITISSGTTATARVTVEQRSPITLVLPILREWTGIY